MSPQQLLLCNGTETSEISPSPPSRCGPALEVAFLSAGEQSSAAFRRLQAILQEFSSYFLSLVLGWCLLAF